MFPSKYLCATDFENPVVVKIKNVSIEKPGEAQEPRSVCSFASDMQPMMLNKTNAAAIANIADSDDSDDWIGVPVELYRNSVRAADRRSLPADGWSGSSDL
jgi:hypothetical protein